MNEMENPTGNRYPDLVRADVERARAAVIVESLRAAVPAAPSPGDGRIPSMVSLVRHGVHAEETRSSDVRRLTQEVSALVAQHPLGALGLALGIGWFAGRPRSG